MDTRLKIVRALSAAHRTALDEKLKEGRLSYRELGEWLTSLGYDVSDGSIQKYSAHTGARPRGPGRVSRIDKILTPEHHAEYKALLADIRTTAREAEAWLKERGYHVSQPTVSKHRKGFRETLDKVQYAAECASAVAQIAREHGEGALTDGMLTQFEQVVFQQLVDTPEGKQFDPKDLVELGKAVNGAVGSRERVGKMRLEFEEAKRKAAQAAEEVAKTGASGKEVVERVREILGV